MLLSAMAGGAGYEAASTAFARAATFRQSFASLAESILAGNVILDAVRLRFGALPMTSLTKGSPLSECKPNSLLALTTTSLAAESVLREALLSFSNPQHPAEQAYIREWGNQVQSFDPTDIPEDAGAQLPSLQHDSLQHIPFSHPTPIVATQWVPRS